MRPRVTIADLMVLVVFAALVATGHSYGSEVLSVGVLVALYLAATCIATVCGRARSRPRRAPWNGFALFGWVWLALWVLVVLHDGPPVSDPEAMYAFSAIGFVGSSLCAYAAARLAPGDETPRPPAGEGGSYSP